MPTDSQAGFWRRVNFWKLAIAKLFCMCVLAACASLTSSLNGIEWSEFTPTQKLLALVALIAAVTTVVVAFLSDTMTKLTDQAQREKQIEDAKP